MRCAVLALIAACARPVPAVSTVPGPKLGAVSMEPALDECDDRQSTDARTELAIALIVAEDLGSGASKLWGGEPPSTIAFELHSDGEPMAAATSDASIVVGIKANRRCGDVNIFGTEQRYSRFNVTVHGGRVDFRSAKIIVMPPEWPDGPIRRRPRRDTPPASTAAETSAVVTLADRWAPTTDCDVRGTRSVANALVIGHAIARADRAGLRLQPRYGQRLPRVLVVALSADEVRPSDDSVTIAVDADAEGHAIVQYMGLGYGNVYCAMLENGRITTGQPPLDARQAPRAFTAVPR